MKNYTEDKALRFLMALGCELHPKEKTIIITKAKQQDKLGNGALGRLDFLTKHCKYTISLTI